MRKAALAAIAAAALLLFATALLRREVFTFRDHVGYFQPLRYFTATELRGGHIPLWNPYSASGEPWLANPQTGIFYPPTWLFVVLPFPTAFVLFLLLHVVLLGWSSYLLFEELTRSPGAALAAATALTFSGPAMSLLDVENNLMTFAWLPLVVWCALRGISARLSAVAIAMSFLAGEPLYAAIAALLWTAVTFARRAGEWRAATLHVVDVAATSFGLVAIQLMPFLEMVRSSDRARGGVPPEQILRDSMPLRDWLRLPVPPHVGTNGFDLHLGQHFIPIIYIGAVPLLFAALGLLAAGLRRALAWLAAIAACAVIAAGSHLPISAAVLPHLPVALFRYPARFVPLAAIAICALAAIGIARHVRRARWQCAIAAIIFVDATLQIAPLLASAPFNPHRVRAPRVVGQQSKIARFGMDLQRPGDIDAWIFGYLNLYERRFDSWTAAPLTDETYRQAISYAVAKHDLPALNASSVGWFLRRGKPAADGTEVILATQNPRAFPLAYFYSETTRIVRGATALAMNTSSARILVDAPTAGAVVITQNDARGWRVTVDGNRENPRKSGLFRAVSVSPGRHLVEWTYRPPSLLIGAVVTLLALVRMLLPRAFVKRDGDENIVRARAESEV